MGRIERRVLLVQAPGYAPKLIEEREELPADWGITCLERGSALEVRVVDQQDRPAAGYTIRVSARTADLDGAPQDLIGKGSYRVGEGRYELPARRVDPITGRRTYLGLEGVQQWECETNATGACLLEGLPPGVELSAEVTRERSLVLTVDDGLVLKVNEYRQAQWRLPSLCRIAVFVQDQFGDPISGHVVAAVECPKLENQRKDTDRFLDLTESSTARARTNQFGRALLEALPSGRYLVGLEGESSAVACDPQRACSRATLVDARENLGTIDIVLAGHRGLYIQGGVHDSSGRPLEGATLMAVSSGGQGRWLGSSEGDGRFCIGPVEPGTYSVTCRHSSGGASTTVEVSDKRPDEAVLVVERGAPFRIELIGVENLPEERFIAGSISTASGGWPGRPIGEDQRTMEFVLPMHDRLVAFAETSDRRVVMALLDPGEAATTIHVESEPGAECVLVAEPDTPEMVVVFAIEGVAFHQAQVAPGQQVSVRLPARTLDVRAHRMGQRLAEARIPFDASRTVRLLVPSLVEDR